MVDVSVVEAVVYRCVRCGVATDWEEGLGLEPLCLSCWDAEAEVKSEVFYRRIACDRRYFLAHHEEIKAGNRRWAMAHRSQLTAYMRGWRACHQDLLAFTRRKYYESHREEILRKARLNRKRSLSRPLP